MNRYFIQISFDGTNYHGWQLQKNAHTVQAELNRAMETVFRQKIETLGCGRTDTGVHATEFFAHFDCITDFQSVEIQNLIFKFNSLLPKDIAVRNIVQVRPDANARFDAVSRTYKYFIHHSKNPFLVNRSYFRRINPGVEEMNTAAKLLLSHNDFSCFSKSRTQVKTNICKIYHAEWKYYPCKIFEYDPMQNQSLHRQMQIPPLWGGQEGLLVFEIKADRFLRNMVRAIVGTLLEVGDGEMSISGFKKILESKNRSMAGTSVPACGLYLTEVKYPEGIQPPLIPPKGGIPAHLSDKSTDIIFQRKWAVQSKLPDVHWGRGTVAE